jgi:hypothetical protein
MPLKNKAKFHTLARTLISVEKDEFLAKASLDYLKPIIPDEVIGRYGLTPVAGNLLNVGVANGNGDVISKEDALGMYKDFKHRFINISHSRAKTIGSIVDVQLTKFDDNYLMGGDSEVLTEDEASKLDVFNIAIAGVIYDAVVGDKFIDFLYDANDSDSANYLMASLSLEIAFDEIAVLRGSRYLSKGEIITDEKEIERLKPHLKAYKDKKNNEK